jgi:PilZ domain
MERRKDPRWIVSRVGLFQNLTNKGDYQTAILKDLSKGGFLIEIPEQAKSRDAVMLSIDEFTMWGEVVHSREERGQWIVGVKLEGRLDDRELLRITRHFDCLSQTIGD